MSWRTSLVGELGHPASQPAPSAPPFRDPSVTRLHRILKELSQHDPPFPQEEKWGPLLTLMITPQKSAFSDPAFSALLSHLFVLVWSCMLDAASCGSPVSAVRESHVPFFRNSAQCTSLYPTARNKLSRRSRLRFPAPTSSRVPPPLLTVCTTSTLVHTATAGHGRGLSLCWARAVTPGSSPLPTRSPLQPTAFFQLGIRPQYPSAFPVASVALIMKSGFAESSVTHLCTHHSAHRPSSSCSAPQTLP